MANFRIARSDGRSNAQVVIDLVKGQVPGQSFPYDVIRAELSAGTDRSYSNGAICQIVRIANVRLLKEYRRELYNVAGVGFTLAHANQHNHLALVRRTKADRQIERGVLTIKQARFEEMDENSRRIAEGTLMILSGIHSQMQLYAAKMEKHDAAIAELYRLVSDKPHTG